MKSVQMVRWFTFFPKLKYARKTLLKYNKHGQNIYCTFSYGSPRDMCSRDDETKSETQTSLSSYSD